MAHFVPLPLDSINNETSWQARMMIPLANNVLFAFLNLEFPLGLFKLLLLFLEFSYLSLAVSESVTHGEKFLERCLLIKIIAIGGHLMLPVFIFIIFKIFFGNLVL
jgi:hypothetical protein